MDEETKKALKRLMHAVGSLALLISGCASCAFGKFDQAAAMFAFLCWFDAFYSRP